MSINLYTKTLYPGRALVVLNGEHAPLFRIGHASHELTQHGHSYTVEISAINGKTDKRSRLNGETLRLGQMLIRFEPSTNHPDAAKLVFLEKPSSFTVIADATAKQAAGM